MSAKEALEKYLQRELDKQERERQPKRKNQKPEKEVQRAVMAWINANGFSCHVIESKAVYNFAAGRYVSGQTDAGVSDIFGTSPTGIAVFIELKAPGKRSTLKEHQRAFLTSKIMAGAFAICVDSVECVAKAWSEFEHLRKMEPMLARNFLLKHLPRISDDSAFFMEAE